MSFLIVTGLSGAGKSTAMNMLEDIGYFCIDNIPAVLLPRILDFARQGENQINKVAVAMDIRGIHSTEDVMQTLDSLRESGVDYQILYLEARDDVLERRYKETRRRHPVSISMGVSTAEAIERERKILLPLYESANYIIDTSLLSVAQHKERICNLFAGGENEGMVLTVMSFGFKFGIPKEADIVLDVRCLPNPFYIPELKEKTGLDQEVVDYVMKFPESQELLRLYEEMLKFSLPLYVKEGKSQLIIAVGCTGGKHRSITFARALADFGRQQGYKVVLQHRDAQRFT